MECTQRQIEHLVSQDEIFINVDVKEAVYKGLVCPVCEYDSCVCDPQDVVLQEEIEKVQDRAAWFVINKYCFETRSMTGILENLRWESLKKRRESRLILLYKDQKDAASISNR